MSSVYIGDFEPNVVLFGDIMLDHNFEGRCNKIANEGPIPVVQIENEKYSIGGCGNVLLNMFALGAKHIHLFSRIGNDTSGQLLQTLLPTNTTNNMILDDLVPTIVKTRIYADKKIVARYDKEKIAPISSLQEDEIISKFLDTITTHTITSVVFSDYNKGFLTKSLCQSIIKLCKEHNIATIVDPKVDYTKYIGCTVIKPNKSETKNIFKLDLNTLSYEETHKTLNNMVDCKLSVITLSGDGISAYTGSTHYRVSEDTKEVIDVTGAGDVVCSVLGTYYTFIDDLNLLLRIANHLASISVSHLGVYTITANDLINTYKFIHKTKQIKVEHLPNFYGKTVVFTNGCFDILHSAHLEVFKYCRQIGDIVIVGLNADASIRRLKGETRPINSLDERLKLLSAIETIDFIIPFEEDTPLNLIKTIKPDYLVKGGDYRLETIVGGEYAKNTIIFNYIEGLSTSNIVNKIKNI